MKTTTAPATLKRAQLGSISHGTLRTQDLLEAFADTLESLILLSGDYLSCNHDERDHLNKIHGEALDCWNEAGDDIDEDKEEEASEMVNDILPSAFDAFAPPYCYFGTHCGDGSDFGFWPDQDAIDELPHVQDSDEARALGEDCKYVNDHGNVTVFNGLGVAILEMV